MSFQETLEKPKLKPKQPKSVRWLSHDAACNTMWKVYPCVLVHLSKAAAEDNDYEAEGLLRKMETWEFVATLHLMLDILPQLYSLSKFFQVSADFFCNKVNAY